MRLPFPSRCSSARTLGALAALGALAIPAAADAAPAAEGSGQSASGVGELTQLSGSSGCLVDRSQRTGNCTSVRALQGPGPILGSGAVALSPDGGTVYVASSKSDAVAIFKRNAKSGKLKQASGEAGCIAADGATGCATAVGLDGPNSVAVSPDGGNVYATSQATGSVTSFRRNRSNGGLTQLGTGGCIATGQVPGCVRGRGMRGADVVAVSPDGANVYVGAFVGDAVAMLDRDPSTGGLTQPDDTTGCIAIAAAPTRDCATALALQAPEGLAVSADGENVYVASALSDALVTLVRDPATGGLTQPANGCITDAAPAGCTTGAWLSGADAVAVSPDDDDVYVAALFSNSLTSFTRSGSGSVAQKPGTTGCLVYIVAVGCSRGEATDGPEDVVVSPDGANVYVAAFYSGAVAVLNRDTDSGTVMQKARRAGCVAKRRTPNCGRGRRLNGVGAVAISPDGRHVYALGFGSDAIAAFARSR